MWQCNRVTHKCRMCAHPLLSSFFVVILCDVVSLMLLLVIFYYGTSWLLGYVRSAWVVLLWVHLYTWLFYNGGHWCAWMGCSVMYPMLLVEHTQSCCIVGCWWFVALLYFAADFHPQKFITIVICCTHCLCEDLCKWSQCLYVFCCKCKV